MKPLRLILAATIACVFVWLAVLRGSGVAQVRIATFNTAFSDAPGISSEGALADRLSSPDFNHAGVVAEIIQRVRPDILLLNEFDTDLSGASYARFQENYLAVSQNGAEPIQFEHLFVAESNTGINSGLDFNNNGNTNNPDDAFGFGSYSGEFGMVVLSRFPIDVSQTRTFQTFRWKDMPNNLLPTDYYSPVAQDVFRLSSKSHWDVAIDIGDAIVHLLAAHPTPPVFDGPEDRNGRRNHDEIRLWRDYVTPGQGQYIYDDHGVTGGLAAGRPFVIAGDYNADPLDGDSVPGAINQLLESPRVNASMTPSSAGATEDSVAEGGLNSSHLADPRFDTSDFNPSSVGNLRVDYVLPSADLAITDSGVFWPEQNDPLGYLAPNFPNQISDHRLVWVDVVVPEPESNLLLMVGAATILVYVARNRQSRWQIRQPNAPA